MTLAEVAAELARRMGCEVGDGGDPQAIPVYGKGYHFVVAPFFGGWQATLFVPDQKPVTFYAEAVEMLEVRLKAKLSGLDANF
jgi:hypothetical protein